MAGSRSDETLSPARACARACARRAVEQFELALDRVGGILGVDRAGIGSVHENQLAVGVAGPDRGRQRIRAASSWSRGRSSGGRDGRRGRSVRCSMPLTSRRRSTARPADCAAFRLERAAGAGGERHRRSRGPRRAACRPRAPCVAPPPAPARRRKRARVRARARHDDAGVAEDFRLVAPAAQATSTCGCDSNSVLRRSMSARSRMLSSCAAIARRLRSAACAAERWWRAWRRKSKPASRSARRAARGSPSKPSAKPARLEAGVPSAMQSVAETKAARNPPRRGRERSLSFAVRIVSGIATCPRNASGVRRATRESAGLYPRGELRRKSPDRERSWKRA